MSRVVLYARYSSDQQRMASIEDQLRLCRDHAIAQGWEIAGTYSDEAASGASLNGRSGILAVLDAARDGCFEIVSAEALDRLSRDQEDVARLFKAFRFAGVKVSTVAEGEIDELHIGLKGTMNALFLTDLANKTRRGLRGRIERGRSGGGLCYGYDVRIDPDGEVGGRVVNEAQAVIVRRVLTEYADVAPDMVWALFCLAARRAARSLESGHKLRWSAAESREQSEMADEIERALESDETPSPDPMPTAPGRRGDGDYYRSDFHANAFRLPIAPMLAFATRAALIEHAASALDWALASLGDRDGRGDTPFEWLFEFGRWLGRLIALLPTAEIKALLIARVDAAHAGAANEIMDMVLRSFMIDGMLHNEALDAETLASWDLLTAWAADRPIWASGPVDAGQHERGMAVSSFFCAVSRGMICGIEAAWPNLDMVSSTLDRAVATFGTEQTAFNAMLALLRARPDRLLPDPGLEWIGRIAKVRKVSPGFWDYASNGERLVLLLRELIAAGPLEQRHRDIVIEVSDMLIELGVKGAAFLQQDLVRSGR